MASSAAFEVVAVAVQLMVVLLIAAGHGGVVVMVEADWCVAKSDASHDALQKALDYACGFGADCTPIQPSANCYLPNTVQAHASYSFNSYYQRKGNAPGACDFAGTATITNTDPSYGSCVYPSCASAVGGTGGTTTITQQPPPETTMPGYGNGGTIPGRTPIVNPQGFFKSKAYMEVPITKTLVSMISCLVLLEIGAFFYI